MIEEEKPASVEVEEEKIRQVELVISQVLLVGVVASLVIIVAGTVATFWHHPSYLSSAAELSRLTAPGAAFPHTWHDVATGLRDLRGQAVVTAGLLLLIATPVLRVAISILGFIYQRDRVFTAITTIVLALLLLSFVLGKVE